MKSQILKNIVNHRSSDQDKTKFATQNNYKKDDDYMTYIPIHEFERILLSL